MPTQPPLTHPATKADGTCDDPQCPCQQWSQRDTAIVQSVETIEQLDGSIATFCPPRDRCDYSDEQERTQQSPEDILLTALTEVAIPSLLYCERKYDHDDQARLNLEAAVEEFRRRICADVSDSPTLRNLRSIIDHAAILTEQQQERDLDTNNFAEAWERGPRSMKHGVEEEQAAYWFRMGGRYKRDQMIELQTDDLRELQRITGERLR